jgi:D-sedoheptulose 7-phosphate isomerase
MKINNIRASFKEAAAILQKFIEDDSNFKSIEEAGNLMVSAINDGNKIISCGNGGSMCDAMHFAEELTGLFRDDRKAIPAIAISDPSHITCVSNDYGFEAIFSRFIEGLGNEGDILLAISTSGNSKNIIKAIKAAREKKMKVICLTGKDGGLASKMCDVEIRSPYNEYSDRTQEIHIKIIHTLIQFIEQEI